MYTYMYMYYCTVHVHVHACMSSSETVTTILLTVAKHKAWVGQLGLHPSSLASSPGHSQLSMLHIETLKAGSGLGTRLHPPPVSVSHGAFQFDDHLP